MIETAGRPITASQLGRTLSHEHFGWEGSQGLYRYVNRWHDADQTQEAFERLVPVLRALKGCGLDSIVEASPPRGGQNPTLLHLLQEATGVQILLNTGAYLPRAFFDLHPELSFEQMAASWIRDRREGLITVDGYVVRPAYIKLLLGDGHPSLSRVDEGLLHAAITTSKVTGMPILCHLLKASSAERALEILTSSTLDPEKFCWAHADREENLDLIDRFVARGHYVAFDQVRPDSYEKVMRLMAHMNRTGRADRVMLSQDLDFTEEIEAKAGENIEGLLRDFYPLAVNAGYREAVDSMLVAAPARFFDVNDGLEGE